MPGISESINFQISKFFQTMQPNDVALFQDRRVCLEIKSTGCGKVVKMFY